jgi:PEP-CTERM motif
MHIKLTLSTLAVAALLASPGARAAAIASPTSTITGTVITFNEFDGLTTTGPLLVAPGVTFTSEPFTVIGANNQDLGDNGLWGARGDIERTPGDGSTLVSTPTGDGNFVASAFVSRRGAFGFDFGLNPVQSVGAFVNQFQGSGAAPSSLTVLAYGQDGGTIESFSIAIDTDAFGYNEGLFLGFQRASADIYGFGIADGTFVLDNLTYAVPEPGSLAMVLAGLGLLVSVSRHRRSGD